MVKSEVQSRSTTKIPSFASQLRLPAIAANPNPRKCFSNSEWALRCKKSRIYALLADLPSIGLVSKFWICFRICLTRVGQNPIRVGQVLCFFRGQVRVDTGRIKCCTGRTGCCTGRISRSGKQSCFSWQLSSRFRSLYKRDFLYQKGEAGSERAFLGFGIEGYCLEVEEGSKGRKFDCWSPYSFGAIMIPSPFIFVFLLSLSFFSVLESC